MRKYSSGHANRGMGLERIMDLTNEIYRRKGLAVVSKAATPWKVQRSRQTGKVINAFPEKKSTVDYHGTANGVSLYFDAKMTKETSRFPLSNVEHHQYEYLKDMHNQGAKCFLLIEFSEFRKVHLLKYEDLHQWWELMAQGGRKSIPYDWIAENCQQVKQNGFVPVDYLEAL